MESTLLPLWRRLLAEQERDELGSRALLRAESLSLLVRLVRSSTEADSATDEHMDRLLVEVERTSFEPWTVDEAARWLSVSRRQFTKTFKAATGKTFVEFLTSLRIARVKELLASGGYTVAGAAYAGGFGDIAHFHRTFKKYEDQTPLEWMGG